MSRNRYVLLAVSALSALCIMLTSACSSSPPREYRDGPVFRPAAPPSFNPAEDAPHTFEPDRPSPLQPGPRPTRVLPETPETRRQPGLWGTEPPRSSAEPTTLPEVAGVLLPYPPGATTAYERAPVHDCANTLSEAVRRAGSAPRLKKLPERHRQCVIALAYRHCADTVFSGYEKHRNEGTEYEARDFDRHKAMAAAAKAYFDLACNIRVPGSDLFDLANEIYAYWDVLVGAR